MIKNTKYRDMEAILPHKQPMVLVDDVLEYDLEAREATVSVSISDQSLFYDSEIDGVPVWVGIEYMAQSIGALAGILSRENGGEPGIAFLLGTRSYNTTIERFENGKTYKVHLKENFTDSELGNYRCEILNKDEVCATAELNTFKPGDPQAVLTQMKK